MAFHWRAQLHFLLLYFAMTARTSQQGFAHPSPTQLSYPVPEFSGLQFIPLPITVPTLQTALLPPCPPTPSLTLWPLSCLPSDTLPTFSPLLLPLHLPIPSLSLWPPVQPLPHHPPHQFQLWEVAETGAPTSPPYMQHYSTLSLGGPMLSVSVQTVLIHFNPPSSPPLHFPVNLGVPTFAGKKSPFC